MTNQVSCNTVFDHNSLKDRRILVTGASSGIGANSVKLFSSLGADVILVGRNEEKLNSVSDDLSRGKSLIQVVDLSVPDLIYHQIKTLPLEWLPIHGVLHASGTELVRPVQLIKSADFESLMSSSVKAALSIGRAISSKGVMSDGGAFVLMSSVAAITGTSGLSLYSATKGAIEAMTRSLAVEFAPKSIRVNAITSGAVETPMHHRLITRMPQAALEDYESKHPLGFGQPSDISNLAAFLMSDAGRWITGTSLIIDGGYSAL